MDRQRRELFERHPATREFPWAPLADLPTPVTDVPSLAALLGARSLTLKRDDLSGVTYGGNKVRKLEFLLGDALASGAPDIITFGAAGSNHALATAIYGASLGLKVHSMLMPQPNALYVRRNVRASLAAGADLHHFSDAPHMMRGAARLRGDLRRRTGREPYVVPFGGTTPLSTLGHVNAAFELVRQVEEGALPEPDMVFVALGSRGTAAGLALGLRAAGLRTRVVAVPVISEEAGRAEDVVDLVRETQALLTARDEAFPDSAWDVADIDVALGFIGPEYARFTAGGLEAIGLAREHAGVGLEGTYTGKAFAALLAWGREGLLQGRDVVFWDTYNSRDISALAGRTDVESVPARLRPYFDDPVQDTGEPDAG